MSYMHVFLSQCYHNVHNVQQIKKIHNKLDNIEQKN